MHTVLYALSLTLTLEATVVVLPVQCKPERWSYLGLTDKELLFRSFCSSHSVPGLAITQYNYSA